MKRLSIFIGITTFLLLGGFMLTENNKATAADLSLFRPGRIIDDSVFVNNNSMSASEIQNFLIQKNSVCLKDFRSLSLHDDNGDGVVQDSTTEQYGPTTMSAAELIKAASDIYKINPKVLLVTLQKEQGLITTADCAAWKYNTALGYGCPDTAPCDESAYGFTRQIDYGTYHLRGFFDDSLSSVPYGIGNQQIYWHPDTARCGSANVYIENRATASLYSYTPYQPNQASLSAGYGLGDSCSSYGNRNFFSYFNDWFGSTIGPEYAWSIESYTYSGGDNIIVPGQTETVTLKARNTGRATWYNSGANPARLGTWEPADRYSNLFKTNRLATLTESSVAPNEIGTFNFSINPSQEGTFVEGLNLVAENKTWMAWPGLRPTINVPPAYQWDVQNVIYDSGTGMMEPGTKQLITVIAKNTGAATWSKTSGPEIKLATWQPDRKSAVGATWLSSTRVAYMNEASVAPGQTAGFQFYVTIPSGGNFYEKLNLVAEGQRWFNDDSLTLYLHGKTYAWQPLWHSHSTGTANVARNTEFTVTLKVKNTGEMTWRKNANFPVRVGTASPLNRGSAFYAPSWITDTRPTQLLEDTVEPGQEGTFIIPLKTPSITGQRYEYFSLLAEGVLWMNNPGFNVYVNVQ